MSKISRMIGHLPGSGTIATCQVAAIAAIAASATMAASHASTFESYVEVMATSSA
jgi:hypothetical protein